MENNNTRRRRQTPPFSQVGTLNTVKEKKILLQEDFGYYYSAIEKMEFSPYVKYIPINYLTKREQYQTDEEYINHDLPIRISSRAYTMEAFEDISRFLSRTGRTIIKSLGCYSLIYNDEAHILACILPENLVYQKLHILNKGTIDLSKVIIFINSELDNTSFPTPSIRTLYRTELLPKIVETSCTVFKVPLSFIMENCFYKVGGILPLNIEERRRFKSEMLDDFRESKKVGTVTTEGVVTLPEYTTAPILSTSGDGIWRHYSAPLSNLTTTTINTDF